MTPATQVLRAEPTGDGLRLSLSDGTTREVDHLMFGTGYRVDVTQYPFLSGAVVRDLRVVNGYPVLGRGLESSIPGLHVLGAPAARSFGPRHPVVSAAGMRAVSSPARSAAAHEREGLGFTADRARRGASGALYPQSALAGLNSLSRGQARGQRPVSGR